MAELAVVTGASAGFGRCFALQLAERGYDLVLVARREDRLQEVASQVLDATQSQNGPAPVVQCLAMDLLSASSISELLEAAPNADLVVNNAGSGLYGPATEIPTDQQLASLKLNCEVLTNISLRYANRMLERGRGTILNLASTTSFMDVPWMTVYAATKAYVLSFSQSLDHELLRQTALRHGRRAARRHGPRVLAVCPGYSPTEFQEISRFPPSLGMFPMTPEEVVRQALVAMDQRHQSLVPGLGNKLTILSSRLSPRRLVRYVAGWLMEPPLTPTSS